MDIFPSLYGDFPDLSHFLEGRKNSSSPSRGVFFFVAPLGSDTEVTDFANWESWHSSYSHRRPCGPNKNPIGGWNQGRRVDGVDML